MDLRSGYPFWFVKNGFLNSYPSLSENINCEVAIIGGGITGAICAYSLSEIGVNVVAVDQRHIATGSTCASTSLLQYEIDTPLFKLVKMVGEGNAISAYKLCLRSIDEIKKIVDHASIKCEFEFKKSLYLASFKKDVDDLKLEYNLRKRIGIDLQMLTTGEIKQLTGFEAPAALFSSKGAQMDAYRFTHGLWQYLINRGCRVYDKTKIVKIEATLRNAKLITQSGNTITCKKFVYANGYESKPDLNKGLVQLHSTYAIISKPVVKKHLSSVDYLMWETSRPYFYMRTTADNRIIAGGKDEAFYSPAKRDRLITQKSNQLLTVFKKKYPLIPFEIDFSWAGTFGETEDGLPFIGKNKSYPHAYFALGFGGNGITFSQIAGEIISNLYSKKKNKDMSVFSFVRNDLK